MNTEALIKSESQQPLALQFSAFGNITHFENAQRMAKALCASAMVPEAYRCESNLGSCLIALEISNRIGMNVLAVMQNLYQVHGKPAWSSQFLIACVNASGLFSPMRYDMTGNKTNDTYGCIAWATDKLGQRLESPEVTVAMAKAEGWYQKNGSKWKTMPELMLRYRAATFFARLYAPGITMGILSEDEVVDITEVLPTPTTPADPNPVFVAPAKRGRKAKAEPQPSEPVIETETAPAQPETPAEAEQPHDDSQYGPLLSALRSAGVTEDQLVAYYNKNKGTELEKITSIPEASLSKLTKILSAPESAQVKSMKGES